MHLVCAALLLALAAPPGRFAFRSYGSEQGLENLSVVAILQDAEGFLWVATEDGLYRYDGDRFHRYGAEEGLPSSEIHAMALGSDGRLAAGTFRGVARFEQGRFRALDHGGLPDLQINSMAAAPDGALWVATRLGVFVERNGQFRAATGWPAGTGASSVWADGRGIVVAAHGGGIWTLPARATQWSALPVDDRVDAVVRDAKGTIWARSPSHLWSLAEGQSELEDHSRLLPGTSDTGYLWLDQQGTLWVPTDSGLLYREEGEPGFRALGPREGLPSSWARAVAQDREGSVWIGATGVHRLVGRGLWRVYSTPEGLPSEVVWTEWRDADGRLYVGTDRGLARAAGDRFETVPGTEGHAIRAVAQTPDGALWMGGSPPEALRLDPKSGHIDRFGAEEGVEGGKLRTLLATSRGELLLGTDSGGLLRLAGKRFVPVAVPGGSVRERFSQLIEDRAGRVWAGGELGLGVRRKDEWQRLTSADGLRDERISYILERRSGDICVGYRAALGFSCFQPTARGLREMQHFDNSRGLVNNRVYQLGEDRNGRLWVGTGQGVDVFDAHGVEHFGHARGMPGDDCDSTAFLGDPNGDVWVGTSTGLGRFIGGNYPGLPDPPRPVIVEARVGTTRLSRSDLRLSEKDAALEVHFAGLSFLDEARVQHQVRLVPLETDFRLTAVREARYSALQPGSYAFEVRARMPPGQWSETARLAFVLLPQWWQTAWFRALCVVCGTLLVGLIVNWRLGRLQGHNRELQRLISTRTIELAEANQALRDLSVSDPLTGLKNRRYLELAMPETVAQALRNRRGPKATRNSADLLLLVVDLDDFKSVNDTHGHAAGDRVLQQAARLVAQLCRESDSAVRWGGEEFVVVARNADRASAGSFAERVCELFRGHSFEVGTGQTLHVTCSVGVAAFPFVDLSWREVVELADHCLYAAKRAGKDRWALVEAAPSLQPEALRGREFAQLVAEGQLLLTLPRRPQAPLRAVAVD